MKRIALLIGLALFCAGLAVFTLQFGLARNMLISDAEVRGLPDGSYVALLSIDNQGPPDRLVNVSSDMVSASIYSPVDTMGPPVPTGSAALAVDGAHITLTSDTPLEPGTLIPLELHFEKAGIIRVKPRLRSNAEVGAAAEMGLFGLGEICIGGENGEPAPKVWLNVSDTETGWEVNIVSDEFEFSHNFAGSYHIPGMGHGHIYVGGMKLARVFDSTYHIGALPAGQHEIRVTLNTNDHRAYVVDDEPVTASAIITAEAAEKS